MRNKNHKRRHGFTLIELLLVAGILAVLAAFAIPSLMGQATKAKIDLARAAVGPNGPLAKALNGYKWDMGRYPDTDEGIDSLMQPKREVDDEKYGGPYIENDIVRDPWGNPFEYRSPGEFHEEGFDLWSLGPNKDDDSDDIKNWIEK